jgi:hypothetical protein
MVLEQQEPFMSARIATFRWSALAALFLISAPSAVIAGGDNGVVRLKSAYAVDETVARLKQDVAAKGIKFFDEIDQSKLAAEAGIKLRPSTLLIFGNPPLGTQFITANPEAGLDWRFACSYSRTRRAPCGRHIPISPGSPAVTESRTGRRNSRWPPR